MFGAFSTALTTTNPLAAPGPSVDPRKREIFMCVPAVRGPVDKSCEENRVEDYLKSYSTTSLPPQPVPEEPRDEHARLARGYPPSFQPHVEVVNGTSSNGGTVSSFNSSVSGGNGLAGDGAHITHPANIPDRQMFQWVQGDTDKERFMNIACLYTHFSPEELRYHAYSKGNVFPPPGPDPVIVPPPTMASSGPTIQVTQPGSENWQSITCRPEFTRHSFEELRLSYLTSGRELTSDEILQFPGVGGPRAPTTSIFGMPPAAPAPLFSGLATPTPNAGLFGRPAIQPF